MDVIIQLLSLIWQIILTYVFVFVIHCQSLSEGFCYCYKSSKCLLVKWHPFNLKKEMPLQQDKSWLLNNCLYMYQFMFGIIYNECLPWWNDKYAFCCFRLEPFVCRLCRPNSSWGVCEQHGCDIWDCGDCHM